MERLEGYENVDHVLSVLAEFHRRLAGWMSELGEVAEERRGLEFRYVARQHTLRSEALADFRSDADPTLLRSWFQIPFPENPADFLRGLASQPDAVSLTEILAATDGFIDRLLSHLHDRAETAGVKALFQDLLDSELRDRRLRSRALDSFSRL
ncbi:MAG: hypothetical protein AB7O54_01615 [Pseudomonadales bacterium]